MKFLDPNDPFFRHAWVRWIAVLLPLFWAMVELFVMLAAGTYAGWQLFYVRDRD
jgi:hypothetical protein